MAIQNTRTGSPCNCACPGMHNTAHEHPPSFLGFLLNLGSLCSCTVGGYLMGPRIRNDGNVLIGSGNCAAGTCPPQGSVPGCQITYTCANVGGNHTCTPNPPLYMAWTCNDFCCDCNSCVYTASLRNDASGLPSATPDPTTVSDVITFLSAGNEQGRMKCNNLSLPQCSFYAKVRKNAAIAALCGLGSCTNTCANCPDATYTTPAACDAHYGVGNWNDTRNYCDPALSGGPAGCDLLFGAGNWQTGIDPDFWYFRPDCIGNADSVVGCNPCPYCDPENDDCDESGDTPGGADWLASKWGPPCRPCAYKNIPAAFKTPPRSILGQDCSGCANCSDCPSCPDCASFADCNPIFSCILKGPCGSSLEVFAT